MACQMKFPGESSLHDLDSLQKRVLCPAVDLFSFLFFFVSVVVISRLWPLLRC
jgi:hypothetical protein